MRPVHYCVAQELLLLAETVPPDALFLRPWPCLRWSASTFLVSSQKLSPVAYCLRHRRCRVKAIEGGARITETALTAGLSFIQPSRAGHALKKRTSRSPFPEEHTQRKPLERSLQ